MAKKIKVMVFGSFDGLHPGHLNFFRQAKKRSNFLIAVIGRNTTILRQKGHLPILGEKERLRAVKRVKMVNIALLGDKKDYFRPISQENPDVVCLGYDQKISRELLAKIRKKGIKVYRLKAYKPRIYKSSKLKK